MPAASAPDLALWRTAPYSVYVDCYIHNPAIVFQARVNMATVQYPVTIITYDTVTFGAYTDIKREQLLLIGSASGLDDLGRLWVHSPQIDGAFCADATRIWVSRASQGTRDGEVNLSDDVYLTILDLRMLRAAAPYIDTLSDPNNPATFKDGVIAFAAGSEFRPIVNIGGDRLKVVATISDTADFDFDASSSIVTNPSAGATKTYLWDVADGTIISGSTTTAAITVTYPVSSHARYIQCTVTDDQTVAETGWRLVAVTYPGDPNLISQATLKRRQPADGQEVSLQVDSPLSYLTWPDGTEVLSRQRERYGTTVGSLAGQADAEDMIFAGWIQSEPNTSGEMRKTGYRAYTALQLVDAAGKLKTLPGFPLVVERRNTVGTTTNWQQMRSATMDRYFYHLEKWHSNLWSRVDCYWSGTTDTYPMPTLGSEGQSLWDQIKFIANAIACLLTCDKNGRVWMVGDPNIQPSAAQVSAYGLPVQRTGTVIVDIGTGDWKNWKFSYTRPPRVHWNWGNAVVGSTDVPAENVNIGTVFCVAPGQAPSQGAVEATSGQQLVCATFPQQELGAREYNRYQARQNALFGSISFEIRPGDIGIDPALGEWVTATIDTSTAAQRGRLLSGNFLPVECQYEYDGKAGTCKSTVALEQEVSSAFIAEVDLSKVTTPVVNPPPMVITPPPTNPASTGATGLQPDAASLYVFDSTNSKVWRWLRTTQAWQSWIDLAGLGMSGTLVDATWRVGGNIARLLTTTEKRRLNNYSSGTPALGTAHALTDFTTSGAMNYERSLPDWGIAASYKNGVGIRVAWTTDDVTIHQVTVTANYDTNAGTTIPPGLWLDPHVNGHAYLSAYSNTATGGSLTTVLKETTDYGATWNTISNPAVAAGNLISACLHVPYLIANGKTVYYAKSDGSVGGYDPLTMKVVGAGPPAPISPDISGEKYAPVNNRSISSADDDPNSLIEVGITDYGGSGTYGVFLSRNAGASWVTLQAPTSYRRVYFVSQNAAYLIGISGAVGYFNGSQIIDISVPSGGSMVALMGP